ncbi:helix-turn-helix domain-containing protein [Lunatibacter salilacus]|uniref:helix-turn-helix domain-containing protein n=1 Tax=Lunatibacter salilacus TaxID=2483804 RepID=UPI00131D9939|nr:helix-turn-helix domain-containing protein [Lunatibacter salilacus]
MINPFGDKIRTLRKQKKWTLKKVSDLLRVDQAILSKAERGIRKLTKPQVMKLISIFDVSPEILLTPWVAEKVASTIGEDHEYADEALKLSHQVVAFRNFQKFNYRRNLSDLVDVISRFQKVEKAWIYGSFASKRVTAASDINLAIQTADSFTYFDLADIKNKLENRVGRPIDIGWMDQFREEVMQSIKDEIILIYEKG